MKKQHKQQFHQLSPIDYIKTKAKTLPLYKCFINSSWFEYGFAHIIVSRIHQNGNFTFGIYLIDIYKKGFHSTTYLFNESKEKLDELKLDLIGINSQGDIIVENNHDFYHMAINLFKNPVYSFIYIIFMALLAFHLAHAFQSAFQTMGWNHPRYTPIINFIGLAYSIIIPTGFALIPIYFLFIF